LEFSFLFHFISIPTYSGESRGGSIRRKTRNTSRFSTIVGNSFVVDAGISRTFVTGKVRRTDFGSQSSKVQKAWGGLDLVRRCTPLTDFSNSFKKLLIAANTTFHKESYGSHI